MPTTRAPSVAAGDESPAASALEELVLALADVDSCLAREALAGTVVALEGWAAAPLGTTDGDPVVVLQRRAARALGLLRRARTGVPAADVAAAVADLRDPAGALQRRAALTTGVGARCGGSAT